MTYDNVTLPRPVEALREAIIRPIVAFLRKHSLVRFLVGWLGAICFTLGAVLAPLWSVPLLAWLLGFQVATPLLAAGLGAIYLWYLSREASLSITSEVASRTESHKELSSNFGRRDAVLRVVIGSVGALLVVAGGLCFVLQNVDGLGWTKNAIAPCFSGGLSALGIWYLSGKVKN